MILIVKETPVERRELGKVKLMSKHSTAKPWEGVLLVLRNGTWGTVCNDWFAFSSHQGRIACEEMGFAGFEEYVHPYSALYGDFSDMSPVIGKIICSGTEESILQCTMGDMADVHCSPHQYIALKCTGIRYTTQVDLVSPTATAPLTRPTTPILGKKELYLMFCYPIL